MSAIVASRTPVRSRVDSADNVDAANRAKAVETRARALLLGLVIVWAISWSVIKIGVSTMPPLWFACLRYGMAAACTFAFVAIRGRLRWPAAADWRFVVVSGILQMGAYAALTAVALTRLPPGRASVLAYSTPLWVMPISVWWLGERVTHRGLAGVATGLAGVLIIASPALRHGHGIEPWSWHQLVPYALLLAAAGAWAVTIVYVRVHRFRTSTLALAPWQMLVAAVLLGPIATVFEGARPPLTTSAAVALCYLSPLATAFAYWAAIEIGRVVPATTMSMSLLAVPALGILCSSLILHEAVGLSLVCGLGLITAGIRLTTGPVTARDSTAP
jgi:O-acetylserine/cysteine efflux transporter